MLDRDLVEVRTTNQWPRAFFTEAGMAALRQLVMDKGVMDPERVAHLRAELGLDGGGESFKSARRRAAPARRGPELRSAALLEPAYPAIDQG